MCNTFPALFTFKHDVLGTQKPTAVTVLLTFTDRRWYGRGRSPHLRSTVQGIEENGAPSVYDSGSRSATKRCPPAVRLPEKLHPWDAKRLGGKLVSNV